LTVSTEAIKELRERSGAGIMDCKRALEATDGAIEEAAKILAQQGIKVASKKASRTADQGLIEVYIHSDGRLGALVEINCETDFVARTDQFKELAHNIAMQVAAMDPQYVSSGDIPEDSILGNDAALLSQTFIKDPTKTIQELIAEAIGQIRENIQVKRFTRFQIGK